MRDADKFWLAGLLEGEGWFGKAVPSAPNRPIVEVKMTDKDTIERAANIMGGPALVACKRLRHHRPIWVTRVTGKQAVELMQILRPEMSRRRQQAIDEAIQTFDPTILVRSYFARSKIDERQAAELQKLIDKGLSVSEAAKKLKCSPRGAKSALHRHQQLQTLLNS